MENKKNLPAHNHDLEDQDELSNEFSSVILLIQQENNFLLFKKRDMNIFFSNN